MGILTARAPASGSAAGKEESAAVTSEVNYDGIADNSHDQDALDMQKLGLKQQTKVSTMAAPIKYSQHR
jgi:hypothetical protein